MKAGVEKTEKYLCGKMDSVAHRDKRRIVMADSVRKEGRTARKRE